MNIYTKNSMHSQSNTSWLDPATEQYLWLRNSLFQTGAYHQAKPGCSCPGGARNDRKGLCRVAWASGRVARRFASPKTVSTIEYRPSRYVLWTVWRRDCLLCVSEKSSQGASFGQVPTGYAWCPGNPGAEIRFYGLDGVPVWPLAPFKQLTI